jgi:hypothetical protein
MFASLSYYSITLAPSKYSSILQYRSQVIPHFTGISVLETVAFVNKYYKIAPYDKTVRLHVYHMAAEFNTQLETVIGALKNYLVVSLPTRSIISA